MNVVRPLGLAALLIIAGCKDDGKQPTNSTVAAVKAPEGSVWSETTAMTPEGGIRMGNPNAPVKLVEYGSLSCGHCREFAEQSGAELKALVDKGTVSFEFRTFLLGPQDLPLSLAARCGGAGPFFPIIDQIYANQSTLTGPLQSLSQEEQAKMQSMTPVQVIKMLGDKMGVVPFVQQRGVAADKANACLGDMKAAEQLEKMTQVGQKDFKVTGTPTFVLNGVTIQDFSQTEPYWPQLKAKLFGAGA